MLGEQGGKDEFHIDEKATKLLNDLSKVSMY